MDNKPDDQDAQMEINRKMGAFFARVAEMNGGIHPDPIWEESGNGAYVEKNADKRANIYQPKPPTGF